MPTCTCADSDSRVRVRCVLDAAMCSVMQATLPRSSLGGASSMTLYTVGQHGHDAHLGDAQCEVTSSPPSQQQQQSFVSMTCHGDELSVSTLPMPDVRESLVHHASAAVIIISASSSSSSRPHQVIATQYVLDLLTVLDCLLALTINNALLLLILTSSN